MRSIRSSVVIALVALGLIAACGEERDRGAQVPDESPPAPPPSSSSEAGAAPVVLDAGMTSGGDVEPAPSAVPRALTEDRVVEILAMRRDRITSCGDAYGAKGTVEIVLIVDSSGWPSSVTVKSSPDDVLSACLVGVLLGTAFGKTLEGGTFTLPFAVN